MNTLRESGVILRRHLIWVMLEAGLDPEQLGGAFRIAALRGLQHLGARAAGHAPAVEAALRDSAPEARRLAKRVLQKMGVEVQPPPPPVHLVAANVQPPATFIEWSVNVDYVNADPDMAARFEAAWASSRLAER